MKKTLSVLAVFAFTLVAARADQSFTLSLDGLQEAPTPNASPGTGSGTAFYDSTAGTIALSISFSGLTAPWTADHIHTGAVTKAGPVIVDLGAITTPSATAGSISGTLAFPSAHVANLLAGDAYVNIHTSTFPGGEIRGQLIPVPEPSTIFLVGLGIVGLASRLRRR